MLIGFFDRILWYRRFPRSLRSLGMTVWGNRLIDSNWPTGSHRTLASLFEGGGFAKGEDGGSVIIRLGHSPSQPVRLTAPFTQGSLSTAKECLHSSHEGGCAGISYCLLIFYAKKITLSGGDFLYPSATSRAIISVNPTAKNTVPMLECSPSDISGISSSTTT